MAKPDDSPGEVFTKQMNIVTRQVHDVSHLLINAKLGVAMSDNKVWAEGLLTFYEIFRYLEGAMDRLKHTLVGDLDIEGMRRTDAFEKDLRYYCGEEWTKGYKPRESVVKYLLHLQKTEASEPHLLIAYIYHLYMALIAGGIILRKKRALVRKFSSKQKVEGENVTDFGNHSIATLRKQIKGAMNNIASVLDEETKGKLLEESKMVFELNNAIIRTVQGVDEVFQRRMLAFGAIIFLCCLLFFLLLKVFSSG